MAEPNPIEPQPEEVHALIPQRVTGARPFSSSTTPTLDQVLQIITNALTDLGTHIGEDVPEDQQPLGRLAVSYKAAASIEQALYPEASRQEGSAFESLNGTFIELRDRLTGVIGDRKSADQTSGGPAGSFPVSDDTIQERFSPLGTRRA